jgi:hypothetical protein
MQRFVIAFAFLFFCTSVSMANNFTPIINIIDAYVGP